MLYNTKWLSKKRIVGNWFNKINWKTLYLSPRNKKKTYNHVSKRDWLRINREYDIITEDRILREKLLLGSNPRVHFTKAQIKSIIQEYNYQISVESAEYDINIQKSNNNSNNNKRR
jgi:hypothetical protein